MEGDAGAPDSGVPDGGGAGGTAGTSNDEAGATGVLPNPTPGQELTGGAARVRGKRFLLDVQIGHGISQTSSVGSKHRAAGNAAVKP